MNPNLGMNIAGYISGEFGIGEGVRANIRAAEAANIPFIINNFTRSPHRKQDTTYQNFSQDNPHPVNLIQVNADEVATFIKDRGSSYFENKYNIGFWAWELPEFPPEWQPAFNNFHEIWTYSNYCAEAISAVSPIPVIKIMPSIALPAPSLNREALNLPKDKFIFLFVFDFSSRIERKNSLATIQAFKQAFGEDNSVLLVIKSSNSTQHLEQQKLLKSAIANCSNIKHLDGYLSKNKLNGLLYNCDCYVSLHRCEGFGLTMAEAMFYGKPVIATGYSSNTEFMNVGNSYLVKYKLIPIEQDCGPYKKGNVWAQADVEHAADLMRYVFNNYREAQQIGAIAAEEIKTLLNPQVTGNKIRKRLEYIAEITDNFQSIPLLGTAKAKSAKIRANLPPSQQQSQAKGELPNEQPKVSICIPTYNGEAFIGEAIQSALAQTYANIELIISDDGSTDRTIAIAQSFQSQTSVDFRIILHRNYGLSQNWNFCISQATGQYIKFLFQDDLLAPECIEKMVALAQQNSEIGMVFSPRGITIADNESNPILRGASQSIKDLHKSWSNLKSIQPGKELLADTKCLNNPINKIGEPSTVLIAARVFEEIGLFDSGLSQYVDLDMWWRIMGNYHIGFVDEKLSSLRIHPEQQTWKNFAAGENHKDVVRFYKKLLNSPDYSFLDQQIKQTIRHKLALRTQPSLSELSPLLDQYNKFPSKQPLLALRPYRQQLAEYWLNLPAEKLEIAYSKDMRKAHKLLLDSALKNETLTESEQRFVQQLSSKLAEGGEIAEKMQYLLAAMLYRDAYQLPIEYKNAAIPQWFFDDFLKFLFQSPNYFQRRGGIVKNGQDARSTQDEFSGGTGILPVGSTTDEFSGGTGILPVGSTTDEFSGGTGILPVGSTQDEFAGGTGILPVGSTQDEFAGGTGILPVPKQVIEKGARYQFQPKSEVESYSEYFQQLIKYVAANIASFPDSEVWRYLAAFIAKSVSFQALYLSDEVNLLNILSQRADILEFHLKNIGSQIEWNFPQREPEKNKIRVGFLLDKISEESETRAAIASFEYLDRSKFEIIVYYFQVQDERLGKYCENCADKLVQLSETLPNQVREIRSHDLDILLICTNTTDTSQPSALLCLHRLARVQIATGASTPATTGTRNIDYFIAGDLTLPAGAAAEFREKLITLKGSGVCVSYTVGSAPATVEPTRRSWGATDESVVFMSGAQAWTIIPELRETWAKIIAAVPNSILVLYPFSSRNENYPTVPFYNQIRSLFAEFGIDKKRLVVIKALPSRADCIKCLELADIYLDSYPYSSGCFLAEPLLVGLPVVVRKGQKTRSRQSAAVLEELLIPELVADSENSYLELNTALGTSPELRRHYRERIQQKMAANPKYLDSRACSTQLEALFERLFRE
ncbi:glycosyltransferase [Microcoleus sp. F10_A2]|uniref:glycosyltransferase n=1 Tax=Microcoleus sp. F10_A2 TaxID=3055338 RepID=UPI002FD487F4